MVCARGVWDAILTNPDDVVAATISSPFLPFNYHWAFHLIGNYKNIHSANTTIDDPNYVWPKKP